MKNKIKLTVGEADQEVRTMKNEVKRAVMKRAHELYNSTLRISDVLGKPIFSECLKEAWKEAACCPLCGKKNPNIGPMMIVTCRGCETIYTPLGSKRASRDKIVEFFVNLNAFHNGPDEPDMQAYFDIVYLDGNEKRTHGWYHIESRCVIQFG